MLLICRNFSNHEVWAKTYFKNEEFNKCPQNNNAILKQYGFNEVEKKCKL